MIATVFTATTIVLAANDYPPLQPARQDNPPQQITDCPSSDQLQEWFVPIERVNADIRLRSNGATPPDCSQQLFQWAVNEPTQASRDCPPFEFAWTPMGMCYWPLFFENVQLERYGQTFSPHLEPLLSAAHFVGSFALVPVNAIIDPPRSTVYTLGYHRPGSARPPVPADELYRVLFDKPEAISPAELEDSLLAPR